MERGRRLRRGGAASTIAAKQRQRAMAPNALCIGADRSIRVPRRPAEPIEKHDHERRRYHRSPPAVESDGSQRLRSEFDEGHDGRRPRKCADEIECRELESPDVGSGACNGNRGAEPREEAAGENDRRFVLVYVRTGATVILRQPRITVQPVKAAAQHIEPDVIAGRPAERSGNQHRRPPQSSGDRLRAHRAVVQLAFDDREEVDRQVFHYAPASTPRTTLATRATWASVSEE